MLTPISTCKSYLPLAMLFLVAPMWSQIDVYTSVLTQHNNPQRTGVYDRETVLTPDSIPINANSNHRFGVLVIRKVDDRVSAQPLYVSHVMIGGVPKNVLYVVTRNNTIYAFDADNGDKRDKNNGMVWQSSVTVSLKDPDSPLPWSEKPVLKAAPLGDPDLKQPCDQTIGNVGILSTPVIDVDHQKMYLVARFGHQQGEDGFGRRVFYDLISIDITTGQEKHRQRIDADGFQAYAELNRPGLLLMNGFIYIAFGAPVCDKAELGDGKTPHGYVFTYSVPDLHYIDSYNTSPKRSLAGIWQSGAGLAGDPLHGGQSIFATTGNNTDSDFIHYNQTGLGTASVDDVYHRSRTELGESIIKLDVSPDRFKYSRDYDAQVPDHFTAGNWYRLDLGLHCPATVLPTPPGQPPRKQYNCGDQQILQKCMDAYNALPKNKQTTSADKACGFGGDSDLGSGGPVILSNGFVLAGGKQGRIYILDPSDMKHPRQTFQAGWNTWHLGNGSTTCSLPNPFDQPGCIVSSEDYDFDQAYGPNIHGAPVVWQPATRDFGYIYLMAEKDYLRGYKLFKDGHVDTHSPLEGHPKVILDPQLRAAFGGSSVSKIYGGPVNVVQMRSPDGMPGGALSLSSNGDKDGIVWVSLSPQIDASTGIRSGVLMAFEATTLRYLWSDPDPLISFAKFVPLTVAGGKVFRATFGDGYSDTACSPANNQYGKRPCGSIVIYGIQRRVQAKKFR
jgi:outer membrane protein assembly factor BamB